MLMALECAKVRSFVTPIFLCRLGIVALICALPCLGQAEVVHMKNGDLIYADRVRETENTVQYEIGDDSYTVPKSRIDHVERGTPLPPRHVEVPTYVPASPVLGEGELLGQVVREGSVNREALNLIESRGNSAATAVAFYIAGKQEFQDAKYADARRDFEAGMRYDPQNPAIANFYAALLIKTGNAPIAIEHAERAVRLAPDSADALVVLGFAHYAAGDSKQAAESWKRSLALRPDASIQRMLDRATRELTAETNYSERETGHFTLRYEGAQSSESFRGQILAALEAAYTELAQAFGVEPRSNIQVILYTNQAFFDVTHAPSWTGALNDGKLRIPLQGIDSVTPDLARILKHELAHSFVNQLSMRRCPTWLNEGIAQAMEPRPLAPLGAQLGELFKQEREIPLNVLEGSFASLSGAQATLAYDESLATVEYIRSTYGMSDVLRVLEKLGQGDSAESALRSIVHSDYRRLQDDVGAFLIRQFGN
jgi:tetratricopeptide (TPR) repeat protein